MLGGGGSEFRKVLGGAKPNQKGKFNFFWEGRLFDQTKSFFVVVGGGDIA